MNSSFHSETSIERGNISFPKFLLKGHFSKNHIPALRFQAWIEQVYGFTMDSLRRWEVMPNSKHYLLGFWAAMVSPVILLQASWGPETEGEYFGLCGCVELYTKTKTIKPSPLDLWPCFEAFFGWMDPSCIMWLDATCFFTFKSWIRTKHRKPWRVSSSRWEGWIVVCGPTFLRSNFMKRDITWY